MFGVGSGTLVKLVIKEDGGPNWFGIIFLALTLLVLFIWRCCVFVPEYWVATRRRFNRVVRNEDGMPREYDPLKDHPRKPGKKVRAFRFRFYLINSLVLVNCGKRETNLDIDAVTLGEVDFDTAFSAAWGVSRAPGNPTKSFLRPAEAKWRWRSEKDELEQLVRKHVADAVLRSYEAIGATIEAGKVLTQVPLLNFEADPYLRYVRYFLLEEYGVEFTGILYGRRSVSPARRAFQGLKAIADANHAIAAAIAGTGTAPAIQEQEQARTGAAAAAAGSTGKVLDFPPPSAS